MNPPILHKVIGATYWRNGKAFPVFTKGDRFFIKLGFVLLEEIRHEHMVFS